MKDTSHKSVIVMDREGRMFRGRPRRHPEFRCDGECWAIVAALVALAVYGFSLQAWITRANPFTLDGPGYVVWKDGTEEILHPSLLTPPNKDDSSTSSSSQPPVPSSSSPSSGSSTLETSDHSTASTSKASSPSSDVTVSQSTSVPQSSSPQTSSETDTKPASSPTTTTVTSTTTIGLPGSTIDTKSSPTTTSTAQLAALPSTSPPELPSSPPSTHTTGGVNGDKQTTPDTVSDTVSVEKTTHPSTESSIVLTESTSGSTGSRSSTGSTSTTPVTTTTATTTTTEARPLIGWVYFGSEKVLPVGMEGVKNFNYDVVSGMPVAAKVNPGCKMELEVITTKDIRRYLSVDNRKGKDIKGQDVDLTDVLKIESISGWCV